MKEQIKTILERHTGRSKAYPRRLLREQLGLEPSQDRKMRLLISELRQEGFPILFATEKPAGYYMPETLSELQAGMDKMRSYIIDECIILRDFRVKGRNWLNKNNQMRMF